jgi:hypothetical protein
MRSILACVPSRVDEQQSFTRGTVRYALILDPVGNHSITDCRRA